MGQRVDARGKRNEGACQTARKHVYRVMVVTQHLPKLPLAAYTYDPCMAAMTKRQRQRAKRKGTRGSELSAHECHRANGAVSYVGELPGTLPSVATGGCVTMNNPELRSHSEREADFL